MCVRFKHTWALMSVTSLQVSCSEKVPCRATFSLWTSLSKVIFKNNIANIFLFDSNIFFILRRWIQRASHNVCEFLRHEIRVRPADFKPTFDVSVSAMPVWARDTWFCLISLFPYERLIIFSSHMYFQIASTRWKKANVNTVVACQYLHPQMKSSWICVM